MNRANDQPRAARVTLSHIRPNVAPQLHISTLQRRRKINQDRMSGGAVDAPRRWQRHLAQCHFAAQGLAAVVNDHRGEVMHRRCSNASWGRHARKRQHHQSADLQAPKAIWSALAARVTNQSLSAGTVVMDSLAWTLATACSETWRTC